MQNILDKNKAKRWTKWLCVLISLGITENLNAQENAAAGEKPAAPAEAAATPETKEVEKLFPDKEVYTREEVQLLREIMDQKSTKLDQDIETQARYMESLKVQVTEHLAKVEAARNEIADFMNTRDTKEEGKLKKLAKFYEAMDPEQASPLIKNIKDELAIKIFDRMDPKKAGAILAQLPPERAGRLTAAFPKLKIQLESQQVQSGASEAQ